jgi:hypothetical protein
MPVTWNYTDISKHHRVFAEAILALHLRIEINHLMSWARPGQGLSGLFPMIAW